MPTSVHSPRGRRPQLRRVSGLRGPHPAAPPLLTPDEEIELSQTVRRAQRETLALALGAPSSHATLESWLNQARGRGSLPPSVLPRARPEGGERGRQSAREGFARWCRAVIEAGPSATLEAHAALSEHHPLADEAREDLVRNALPELCPARAASVRRAQSRARKARTRFVERNQGLVTRCAQGYVQRGLALSDLVQEGNIGLLRAIERFDPSMGYRFSTYAVWWIRHALGRALDTQAQTIRTPVHAAEDYRKLRRLEDRQRATGGPRLSDEELARGAGVSLERVREFRAGSGQPLSYDVECPGNLPLLERIADEDAEDAFAEAHRALTLHRLTRALIRLDPRERDMMKMRFGLSGHRPHTLKEVGQHFGVTRERARQIVGEACKRLRVARELHEPLAAS